MTRPLVAYCCFGVDYARMLNLSLHSLLDLGAYKGRIVVVSDLGPDELEPFCPLIRFPTVDVARISPRHELAPKLARYRLHRWLDTSDYGPILYVDCDVIFDRPAAGMLAAIQAASAICFPTEFASHAMWEPMGGDLLRAENIFVDGHGCNSGTFGIPEGNSLRAFADLETILATTLHFWTHQRHLFTRWIDQPVVNYLQATRRLFDVATLTPFFRYCLQDDVPDSSEHARLGAVHFFDHDKHPRMRRYLGRLSDIPVADEFVRDF